MTWKPSIIFPWPIAKINDYTIVLEFKEDLNKDRTVSCIYMY